MRDLKPGDTLGGYRIQGVLGSGGMAVVYRATQISLDRPVALKVLSSSLDGDRVFRERFEREGRHVAALDHPNIVPVYEAAEADGRMFIAMKLVDGRTLADRIDCGDLGPAEALRILAQIGSALDAAHAAGFVHRDVKPQNILVSESGHPYLADFGVTKSANIDDLTRAGDLVGSLTYAAPEQIEGHGITWACDVYALGAVLFESVSGRPPFERDGQAALINAHLNSDPPSLEEHGFPELDPIVARGMAKSPDARYSSAEAMLNEAQAALTSDGRRAPRPSPRGRDRFNKTVADARRGGARSGHTTAGEVSTVVDGTKSRRGVVVALVALVIAAPFIGRALGGSGQGDGPKQTTRRAGLIQLTHPAGWTDEGAGAAGVPGLALSDPIALQSDAGERLRAGRLTRPLPGLDPVPASLRRTWRPGVRPDRVRVGSLTALRYSPTLRAGGSESLLLIPTTKGWIAAACESGSLRPEAVRSVCEPIATTLSVKGAEVLEPGPDPKLAKTLEQRLAVLNTALAKERPRLSSRSAAARARGGRRLARAARAAANAIAAVHAHPADGPLVDPLIRALRVEAGHLRRLAEAARRHDTPAYNRERRRVRSADRALRAALVGLARGGYRPN
jgi:hypothetical protein